MTADSAIFRKLDDKDLPELLALESACFSCPWGEEQYSLAFKQNICHVFGLFEPSSRLLPGAPDHLAAYATIYLLPPEMEILNIAVTPDMRRKGYGRRLLRLVLQIARKMGIQRTFLEVRENNIAAQTLYESMGFEAVGVRPHYYPDTGEDARLMRLEMDSENGDGAAEHDMDQGDTTE